MTTPRKPRRHRPFNRKPIDPEEVLEAWKELPGSRTGLTIVTALRIAKDRPGSCGKLLAILGRISADHRARTLAKALDRLVENHRFSDFPYIVRDEKEEYRATRKSKSVNSDGFRRKTNGNTLKRSHPHFCYTITSHCP